MKKTIALALATFLFFACSNPKTEDKTATTDSAVAASAKPQPTEIGDAKYMDVGKLGIASLSSGNIDAWMNSFADNAVYLWNSGDSLVGKAAIAAYWKKRRTEVIDSISFASDIWLPIKVNQPQQAVVAPGNWLLGWYLVSSKYKTGKRMSQWIHTDMHFDANDKIDRYITYIDRSLINAAMKK